MFHSQLLRALSVSVRRVRGNRFVRRSTADETQDLPQRTAVRLLLSVVAKSAAVRVSQELLLT